LCGSSIKTRTNSHICTHACIHTGSRVGVRGAEGLAAKQHNADSLEHFMGGVGGGKDGEVRTSFVGFPQFNLSSISRTVLRTSWGVLKAAKMERCVPTSWIFPTRLLGEIRQRNWVEFCLVIACLMRACVPAKMQRCVAMLWTFKVDITHVLHVQMLSLFLTRLWV